MSRAVSVADELSSISDVDDHGYQTDLTTPAGSENYEGEEIEDFRDREYPQLKGKITNVVPARACILKLV